MDSDEHQDDDSGLDILDLKIDQSQATQGSYTDLYAATPNGVYVSTTTARIGNWTICRRDNQQK